MVYLMVLLVAQNVYGVFNGPASSMVNLMMLWVAQTVYGVFNGPTSSSDCVWCI